jgi:hypothetical protein
VLRVSTLAEVLSNEVNLAILDALIVSILFNLAEVEEVKVLVVKIELLNASKLFTLLSFEEDIVSIELNLAIVEAVNVLVAFISIPAIEPVNEPVMVAVEPLTTIVVPLSCAENIFIR